MTTLQAAIATAIREELDHQGGSLLTLGRPLNMSKSAVSLRLTGQRPWRVDELVIVTAVLGVSADTLLADARKIYRRTTTHQREGLTPTTDGRLLVDCTACGALGSIPAGDREYDRAEDFFKAAHRTTRTLPTPTPSQGE